MQLRTDQADAVISVSNLSKTYASGFQALKSVSLDIRQGEIFALLGPNGAGKTTLIGVICGIVTPTAGTVVRRRPRHHHGLPRRALHDRPRSAGALHRRVRDASGPRSPSAAACSARRANPAYVEKILRDLSLWEKKDSRIVTLSGGMKRRLLIAKALAHEPTILFLDEPTAGVDVELRRDMWAMVRRLRENGVTIILTTHYIEEAEEMADRVGVIDQGEIVLVEEKPALMRKLGKTQVTIGLQEGRSTPSRRLRGRPAARPSDDGAHAAPTVPPTASDPASEALPTSSSGWRPPRDFKTIDMSRPRSRTFSSPSWAAQP